MYNLNDEQKQKVSEIRDAFAFLMELLSDECLSAKNVPPELNQTMDHFYDEVDSLQEEFNEEVYANLNW